MCHARISASAILQDDIVYSLPRPARHHHVIRNMVNLGVKTPIIGEQGFITETGKFVSREDAHFIALAAGQIIRRCGGDENELFSENLW